MGELSVERKRMTLYAVDKKTLSPENSGDKADAVVIMISFFYFCCP